MITRTVKYAVVLVLVLGGVGGLLFGTDLFSYMNTSARRLRASVKDSIPMELELQRARDLLEEIVPEIHANVRLIAQEEVEVENLKRDIAQCRTGLEQDQARVAKLAAMLDGGDTYFTISDHRYSRQAIKADLSRRFERHKEARDVMGGKERLLAAREKSLQAAMAMLEKARGQKELLASRIESLEGQYRLVQAASVGSQFHMDSSKLAQTERLIGEIKKRLDVAERVLAHEGQFVDPIQIDVVNEKDLLSQVHEYLDGGAKAQAAGETPAAEAAAPAAASAPAVVAVP